MKKNITCSKIYRDIPFAHRQPKHDGHCRFIHGHNWSFEFEFVCEKKDDCGFVIDFGKLHELKNWLENTFDHALVLNADDKLVTEAEPRKALDAVLDFTGRNLVLIPDCSCEGLAEFVFNRANEVLNRMTDGRVAVSKLVVFEDSKNYATYQAEFVP